MCGITGFINQTYSKDECNNILQQMTAALNHRGPDDHGGWISDNASVALGHTRLSIQDLSAAGHQPMFSHCGRYCIVYNGEIYNFEEIKAALSETAGNFSGHSDTEVILAAIAEWGLEKALLQFNGMFAFALFDIKHQKLSLARDRVGIKPLYYGWQKQSFLFASELKSLLQHPDFEKTIDTGALTLFMRYTCIPQPYSIYENIKKLKPGTYLTLDLNSKKEVITEYWDPRKASSPEKLALNETDLLASLHEQLSRSVVYRMKADVNYGAFLSGGIDSSLITALMQEHSSKPVNTFSIGFHNDAYNEAEHASAVAKHLHTNHHELYVTEQDAMNVIPQLASIYDEPFADSSQIPTFIVSKFAREHVTVCLSGDGGDELFAGYHRHFMLDSLWKGIQKKPMALRKFLALGINTFSPDRLNELLKFSNPLIPKKYRSNDYANKLHKLSACLKAQSLESAYADLVIQWRKAESLVKQGHIPTHSINDRSEYGTMASPIENLMYLDFISYLQDDLLCKVDRASMATSLEARVPFLDHHFVEFAWKVPMQYKIQNNQGKYLLRQLLYQYVPQSLIDRPKMGFSIPLEHWLRNDLRDWAESLLDPRKIKEQNIFDEQMISRAWKTHLSGKQNLQNLIWPVLMFQEWQQHYFK